MGLEEEAAKLGSGASDMSTELQATLLQLECDLGRRPTVQHCTSATPSVPRHEGLDMINVRRIVYAGLEPRRNASLMIQQPVSAI